MPDNTPTARSETLVAKLIAFTDFLNAQAFFKALQRGLALSLPLVMIGALALLVRFPPFPQVETFLEEVFGPGLKPICDNLIAGTFGISSLIALLGFAGELTNHHNQNVGRLVVSPLVTIMVVVSSFFLLVAPRDGASLSTALSLSNGLLVSLVVAATSGSLFLRLSRIRQIRMPLRALNSDPVVGDVFSVMPAGMITVLLFAGLREGLSAAGVSSIPDALGALLSAPFAGAGDSLGLALAYTATTQVLWIFGAHGPNVLYSVQEQLLIPATIANNTAVVMGQQPEFIFTSSFFDVFTRVGGSGGTLSLIVAMLLVSRSGGAKKFALIAFVPALFNVNEPLLFGIPLVLNPIYAVPFVLTPIFQTLVAYAASVLEWMPRTSFNITWTTPVLVSGYAVTGSFAGLIVQLVGVVAGIAIYAPFVRLADRQAQLKSRTILENLLSIAESEDEGERPARYLNLQGDSGRMALILARDLEAELDHPDGRLVLEYQPLVDASRTRIKSVEALLRWHHPHYGRIAPPVAVTLAEDIGLINKLGQHVLDLACKERMTWRDKISDEISISVNVTPIQLLSAGFVNEVMTALQKSGLPPSMLELEIIETSIFLPEDSIIQALTKLREYGVRIALDDFGMGYTSLHYLREMPLDTVKIDRSFTTADNGQINEHIVESIVRLSQNMGIAVVVEGIEQEEQFERFKNIGCDIFQGFLFSRSLEPVDLVSFIETWTRRAGSLGLGDLAAAEEPSRPCAGVEPGAGARRFRA